MIEEKRRMELGVMQKVVLLGVFIVILFMNPMGVKAAKAAKADIYGFVIQDGTLIRYYGTDKKVIIPDTVTSIGESSFAGNKEMESVVIPDSVKSIGGKAFSYCWGLNEVSIGNGVKSIEFKAFECCPELKSIRIPDSVTEIGSEAFNDCGNLKDIYAPNTLTKLGVHAFFKTPWLLYQRKSSPLVTLGNILVEGIYCKGEVTVPDTISCIGDAAFKKNNDLTSINIPSSVKYIGDSAFLSCGGLKEITIPASVVRIGQEAFSSCDNLRQAAVSAGCIDDLAFFACSKLTTVSIKPEVTSIGKYAFSDTPWLKAEIKENPMVIANHLLIDATTCKNEVTIPESVNVIGRNAFTNNCRITSVSIPATVTGIESEAFFGCEKLRKVNIPNSVSYIGENAFRGSGITSITIPNSVKSVGEDAFNDCNSLITVTDDSSVNAIEPFTFAHCDRLTKISLPQQITSIGQGAFEICPKLTTISIPDTVKSIEDSAFDNCRSLKKMKMSKNITYIGSGVFSFTAWLENNKDRLIILNHILVDGSKAKGNLVIPDTVKMICEGAFDYNHCSITSVMIPASVTFIGRDAFAECTDLKKVILPDNLKEIPRGMFWGCENLSDITLPESITSINDSAFYGCLSLESITLPSKIQIVDSKAFSKCGHLKNVYKQCSSAYISSNAFEECPCTICGIEIKDNNKTLCVGRTCKLEIKIVGVSKKTKAVWSVSDPEIASIDTDGNLTAKKVGTVTVTALTEGLKDSCIVTVKPAQQLTILGNSEVISGAHSEYTIENAIDYKNIEWSVSDPKKAFMMTDSYWVTQDIVASENYTVYITTETGQGQLDVTVKPMEIIGDTIITQYHYIRYTLSDSNTDCVWSISDNTVAEIIGDLTYGAQCELHALKPGTVTIMSKNCTTNVVTSIQVTILKNLDFQLDE